MRHIFIGRGEFRSMLMQPPGAVGEDALDLISNSYKCLVFAVYNALG